jgi:hypothetical protein
MIKNYRFETDFFISQMPNHDAIKDQLILEILNSDADCLDEPPIQYISRCDYKYVDNPRAWTKIFFDHIRDFMDEFISFHHSENWRISAAWFQQYSRGDYHNWHTHDRSNWTNVYFLKLPDQTCKTKLFDTTTKQYIQLPEISEGDILTFPGHILHKSAPNVFNEDKIIISFNSDFYGFEPSRIDRLTGNQAND